MATEGAAGGARRGIRDPGRCQGRRQGFQGRNLGRARSLMDDDLEELKGCVDLGFDLQQQQTPRR